MLPTWGIILVLPTWGIILVLPTWGIILVLHAHRPDSPSDLHARFRRPACYVQCQQGLGKEGLRAESDGMKAG